MSAVMKVDADEAQLPSKLPTMSETLQEWLKGRSATPRGAALKPLSEAIPAEQQIDALVDEYTHLEQGGIAVKVMQGFILQQASALGDESFVQLTTRCDVPREAGRRAVELYQLFNALGDIKLVSKAERLGARRILELMPHFRVEGIRQLIEGAELEGLKYSTIEHLPTREIALWVRQRKSKDARDDVEKAKDRGELVPDYTPTPDESHWMRLVREQSVLLAWRIHAELGVLTTLCENLATLEPATAHRLPRAETAALVLHELNAIRADIDGVDEQLRKKFANALDAPRADSRPVVALKALREQLHTVVAKETGARAGECVSRTGVRGRPTTTLYAAIESALKSDAKPE